MVIALFATTTKEVEMNIDNLGNENIDMAVGYSNGYKKGYAQGKRTLLSMGIGLIQEGLIII